MDYGHLFLIHFLDVSMSTLGLLATAKKTKAMHDLIIFKLFLKEDCLPAGKCCIFSRLSPLLH